MYTPTPDYNTAITRFFAGDADFFEQLRPEHLAQIAKDTTRRAIPFPSLSYAYLALNNVDGKQPGQPHPLHPRTVARGRAVIGRPPVRRRRGARAVTPLGDRARLL